MLIATLILLGGCVVNGSGSLCDDAPIFVAPDDRLTSETARQVLRHNERGRALCGW